MVKQERRKAVELILPLAIFCAGCFFTIMLPRLDPFIVSHNFLSLKHSVRGDDLIHSLNSSTLEGLKVQIVAEIKEESEYIVKSLSQKMDLMRTQVPDKNTIPVSSVAVQLPESLKNTINDVKLSLLKLESSHPSNGYSRVSLSENIRRGEYRGPRQICSYPEKEIHRILSMPHDCKRKGKNVFAEGEWMTSSSLSENTKEKNNHKSDVLCVIACIDHLGVCRDEKCLVPLHMRRATTDARVIYQMLEDGELDIVDPRYEFKSILDAGGNCGIAAALLATMYPEATIVSVEPSSKNYNILRLNTKRFHNVHPVKAALWARVSRLSLAKGPGNGDEWGFMVYESDKVPTNNLVEDSLQGVSVTFLMDLFNLQNFDFVKMDIEGSEQEVFSLSTDNPLDWVMNCKMIIVEMHEWMKKGSSENPRSFFESSKDRWSHSSFGGYEIYKAASWTD